MGGSRQLQIIDYLVLGTSIKDSFCHTHMTVILFSQKLSTESLPEQFFSPVSLLYLEITIQNPEEHIFNIGIWSIYLIRIFIAMSISMVVIHQYLILFRGSTSSLRGRQLLWLVLPLMPSLVSFIFSIYVVFAFSVYLFIL